MSEYIYRVDTQSGLEKIEDNHFRAKRWRADDRYAYPHKLLAQLHSTLLETEGIFRICFYTSFDKAEHSKNYDFSHFGESFILRCPKTSLASAGFSESWDDGFNEGDAYLFWIKEVLSANNTKFSSAGVEFPVFEILKQGEWQPLKNYFPEKTVLSGKIAEPEHIQNNFLSVPMPEKRQWWKFWRHSNG